MKKGLRIFLLCLCAAVFLYAAWQLIRLDSGYRQSRRYYSGAASAYVETVPETAAAETAAAGGGDGTGGAESAAAAETSPAAAPVKVDWAGLLAENPDVVGWLYGEGTPLNYPVVQGADNDYYLHRMLDGTASRNGTIFLDAAASADFTSDNSFLYGHNMKDGSMFHSLLSYEKQDYYDAHPVLYLLTPERNYEVRLFAGFVTKADSWAYTAQFASAADRAAYLAQARENSFFESAVAPGDGDLLLTLSTCSYEYDEARYVVLGVLTPVS